MEASKTARFVSVCVICFVSVKVPHLQMSESFAKNNLKYDCVIAGVRVCVCVQA